MNHEMATALTRERQRELGRQRQGSRGARGLPGATQGRRVPAARALRIPRYRVSWSRTSLSPAAAGIGVPGAPGAPDVRGGRSWVIVISATKG